MNITKEFKEDYLLITPQEDIDLYSAPDLKEVFRAGIAAGTINYVLDLQKVYDLDSSAMGVLLYGATIAKQSGGRLTCRNLNSRIEKLFKIGRFNQLFSYTSAN